jgi:molecular chaperone Hsp33
MDQHDRDTLTLFLLDQAGVRGALVHLDESWAAIQARAPYPPDVAERLGETCAAAALFTGHAKLDGRLSVQLRGTGAMRTLFAECTSAGTLRGIAHYQEPLPSPLTPRAFGDGSVMAITIETLPPGGQEMVRYQGLVSLQADTLATAFEDYFAQSEQLPTRIQLAASGDRAAALLLQQLPRNPAEDGAPGDADGWTRASALFDTLGPAELLETPDQTLLYRLFHQESVRLVGTRPLAFACSCSRERVEDTLRGLGEVEILASLRDGQAEVHCDFCGKSYLFSEPQLRALFEGLEVNAPSSDRLQ